MVRIVSQPRDSGSFVMKSTVMVAKGVVSSFGPMGVIGGTLQCVMVLLKGGFPMSFGGNEGPTSYGEVVSIGGLGPGMNGKLSAMIVDI